MRIRLAASVLGVLITLATPNAFGSQTGIQCPSGIDANDCVANDLQPTGAEIIEGPTHCTEGETFSALVRIEFEDGGGANARYSVGFYVGENGEPAIGGSSCTFDSLQPVGDPIDLTGGSGGFLELNGDECGDISKSDPTYKDIEMDNILCKDDDGDGNVDITYVLTWENNANQADCQDPLDPVEFEPNPPKCLSDLEADLPIEVEQPPSIEVGKGAIPSTLNEPGGIVTYPITIINTSPNVSDPVSIEAIIDEPYGDITDQTDCSLPFVLAVGQSVTCNFVTQVTGVSGDIITDTVTVYGMDDEGEPVEASDTAQVEIVDQVAPLPPGDLRMLKFATPSAVDEPGGMVQYDVLVANVSPTAVELTSLVDDLYGDLNGKGTCSVPQTLKGASSIYFCQFEEPVSGEPGDIITDTITAEGYDNLPERTELVAQASASVEILDVGSDIEVGKAASPEIIAEPGTTVNFTLRVQNHSVVDQVTVNTLLDSTLGVPEGDCAVPFTLEPGGDSYQCTYPGLVTGNADETVTNVVLATGIDDDGQLVADLAAASVFIVGAPPSIELRKVAIPAFALDTGSPVLYLVGIQNTSSAADPVTITSLEDDIYGNLDGLGTCDLNLPDGLLLPPAPDPDSLYICGFTIQDVSGTAGETLTDTITAMGADDENTPVQASDSATVTFVQGSPSIAEIKVEKFAAPLQLPEPGGDANFFVVVANTSDPEDSGLDVTVTSMIDDIHGDLDGKGTCALPINIPVGGYHVCYFTEEVTGPVGYQETDTVTVVASYGEGETTQDSDSATVSIVDVPSSIFVSKSANPSSVFEPGDDVTFEIAISNTSQVDAVTINSLTDSIYGDLNGQGDCETPQVLQSGEIYNCSFTTFVGGQGGEEEDNILTASGLDDDGNEVSGQDTANVAILDLPPSITANKSVSPQQVPANGGVVTFNFTTTNTSQRDAVTLTTLIDSVFGDLNGRGNCSVPQTLQPGESYLCAFSAEVFGEAGDAHVDEIVVSGVSDDGDPVAAQDSAVVRFLDRVFQYVPVPSLGQAGFILLLLLIGGLGIRAVRRRP